MRPELLKPDFSGALGVRRPDMLDNPLTPVGVLRDLHGGGPRAGPHPHDERHTRTLNQPP